MSRLLDTYQKATEAREQRLRSREAPPPEPPPSLATPSGTVRIARPNDPLEEVSEKGLPRKPIDLDPVPVPSNSIEGETGSSPSRFRQRAGTAGLLVLTMVVAAVASWPYRGYLAHWLFASDPAARMVDRGRQPAPIERGGAEPKHADGLATLPPTPASERGARQTQDTVFVATEGLVQPQRQAMQSPAEGDTAPYNDPVVSALPHGTAAGSAPPPSSATDRASNRRNPRPDTLSSGLAAPGFVGIPRSAGPTNTPNAPKQGADATAPAGEFGGTSPTSPGPARPGNRAQALLSSRTPAPHQDGEAENRNLPAAPDALSSPNSDRATPAQALLTSLPSGPSASDVAAGNRTDPPLPAHAGALLEESAPSPDQQASTDQPPQRKTEAIQDRLSDQGNPSDATGTDTGGETLSAVERATRPSTKALPTPIDPDEIDQNPVATLAQDRTESPTPPETDRPIPAAPLPATSGTHSPSNRPDTHANSDIPPPAASSDGTSSTVPPSDGDRSGNDTHRPAAQDPGGPKASPSDHAAVGPQPSSPAQSPPAEAGVLPFGATDTEAETGNLPLVSDSDAPPPQGPAPTDAAPAQDGGSGGVQLGSVDPHPATTDAAVSASPQAGEGRSAEQGAPDGSGSAGDRGDSAPTDDRATADTKPDGPAGSAVGTAPPNDDPLARAGETPTKVDLDRQQGGQPPPPASPSSGDSGNPRVAPSNLSSAPDPSPPPPAAEPPATPVTGPPPATQDEGHSAGAGHGADRPQAANHGPASAGETPTPPASLTPLFPINAQTPQASTQSDLSLTVDIDGALVLSNPYAMFTTGADTRTKASANLTDGSISGHIADAMTSAEVLPGDIVAQGGTALSPKRIATMDFAGYTRAESLFDQPLGAWAESIGGAGVDRIAVMPLTSDASIDFSWDINRLSVETNPSNALSVMRHLAVVTQSPVGGDRSRAVTTLLGFSIISQNGHQTVTTYELPGSTAIGDWLAAAGQSNPTDRPGPRIAVPLATQFLDPLTGRPAVNVSFNVAQYEYSIEAPTVAVRPVAERAGALNSGAMVRWDAAGKRLSFDPIPITVLASGDPSEPDGRFGHDPLVGARLEIDPLLYAGSLNGRDYFLGNEVRLRSGDGEILFRGNMPTVVYDDSLYSEGGFNLFSPLLSLTWQAGDGSSWLDQFVSRMDAEDLFMPELFLGLELPDTPIEEWLSGDFETSANALLSFAASPAVNDSHSKTSEIPADTPAGALANLRTDYQPSAPLESNDQIGTSGISLPEYDPWSQGRTTQVAARRASKRTSIQGVEQAVIQPMIATLSTQLTSQVLEPDPLAYHRKTGPRRPLPTPLRKTATPAVSSASTGLLLTVGLSILVMAGRRRRRMALGEEC